MKLAIYYDSTFEVSLENGDRLHIDVSMDGCIDNLSLNIYSSSNELIYTRNDFSDIYHETEFDIEIITDLIPSHKRYIIHISFIENLYIEIDEIEDNNSIVNFSENEEEE